MRKEHQRPFDRFDAAEFIAPAAILAGLSYCLPAWLGWEGGEIIVWKGAGVGLLAIWAALFARTRPGGLIAAVLALGALGDVLIETNGLTAGAAAFLAGHVLAIILYLMNGARPAMTAAGAVVVACASYMVARDLGVTAYALALGAMAGAAASSRFPRRVAIGAALFVLSDLLIFARLGPLSDSFLPTLMVWPTYFAGQALIAYGVVTTLRRETAV